VFCHSRNSTTSDENEKENEIDSSVENTSFSVRKRRQATDNESSLAVDSSKELELFKKFPYEHVAQGEHFALTRKFYIYIITYYTCRITIVLS